MDRAAWKTTVHGVSESEHADWATEHAHIFILAFQRNSLNIFASIIYLILILNQLKKKETESQKS